MTYKLLKIRKNECFIWLAFAVIVWGVSMIGQCVSIRDNHYDEMSTLIMLGVVSMGSIFWGVGTIRSRFNIAVSMGQTRKSIIFAELIVSICKYTEIILLGIVSHLIQNQIYINKVNNLPISTILSLKNCILFIVGISAFELLCGALYIRFRNKFIWTLWAIYMLVFILAGRIETYVKNNENSKFSVFVMRVIKIASSIKPDEWRGMGIAVFILMLLITGFIFKRQDVKGV